MPDTYGKINSGEYVQKKLVYPTNQIQIKNSLPGRNVEFFNVKPRGNYTYHWT